MTDRVIPIADARRTKPLPSEGELGSSARAGEDTLGRRLHDLRISVTDRCNFRCIYCMPRDVFGPDYAFLPKSELLSFEEIARLARVFKGHGIEKIRLTGGEPLLRRNLERLIEMLADIPGLDLTLTTNGSVLSKKARAQGGGSQPRHGQPRLARRGGVPQDERRRLPGLRSAERHRCGGGRGTRADQDQHGGEARRERGFRHPDGALLQG